MRPVHIGGGLGEEAGQIEDLVQQDFRRVGAGGAMWYSAVLERVMLTRPLRNSYVPQTCSGLPRTVVWISKAVSDPLGVNPTWATLPRPRTNHSDHG